MHESRRIVTSTDPVVAVEIQSFAVVTCLGFVYVVLIVDVFSRAILS